MKERGFKEVYHLTVGIRYWKAEGILTTKFIVLAARASEGSKTTYEYRPALKLWILTHWNDTVTR